MEEGQEVCGGKRLSVEKAQVTLPSGRTKERFIVHPGKAVAMLPVEGEYCYLERQYRFAVGEWLYEVPAGTMDEGETPEETAHRELIEETGMKAATFIPKGIIYPAPGYTDEVITLFEARDLSASDEYQMDDDEMIEVVKIRIDEVEAMILSGEIIDAKTICLMYRCFGCRR